MAKIRVTHQDSKMVVILKLLYLIPLTIILFLPICLLEGIKENWPPFNGLGEFLKEKFTTKD